MGYREIYWASIVLIFMRLNSDCLKEKFQSVEEKIAKLILRFQMQYLVTKVYNEKKYTKQILNCLRRRCLSDVTKAVNLNGRRSVCGFGV